MLSLLIFRELIVADFHASMGSQNKTNLVLKECEMILLESIEATMEKENLK